MLRWQWLPWQKVGKSNYKNSQNYKDYDITQSITAIKFDSQNSADNNQIEIITDDLVEEDDVLDFQRYSQNLANIIRVTTPKFAVGIFGNGELVRLV
jgi:hypothetical protein